MEDDTTDDTQTPVQRTCCLSSSTVSLRCIGSVFQLREQFVNARVRSKTAYVTRTQVDKS